jgi:hypothetical protein
VVVGKIANIAFRCASLIEKNFLIISLNAMFFNGVPLENSFIRLNTTFQIKQNLFSPFTPFIRPCLF